MGWDNLPCTPLIKQNMIFRYPYTSHLRIFLSPKSKLKHCCIFSLLFMPRWGKKYFFKFFDSTNLFFLQKEVKLMRGWGARWTLPAHGLNYDEWNYGINEENLINFASFFPIIIFYHLVFIVCICICRYILIFLIWK